MDKPLVIYHANCYDGFSAAWVFWHALGGNVDLWPAKYGEPPPRVEGREVYIVDFSYPRNEMLAMKSVATCAPSMNRYRDEQHAAVRSP